MSLPGFKERLMLLGEKKETFFIYGEEKRQHQALQPYTDPVRGLLVLGKDLSHLPVTNQKTSSLIKRDDSTEKAPPLYLSCQCKKRKERATTQHSFNI